MDSDQSSNKKRFRWKTSFTFITERGAQAYGVPFIAPQTETDTQEPSFTFVSKPRMSSRRFAKRRQFRGIPKRRYTRKRGNPGVVALKKVNQLIKNQEQKFKTANTGTCQIAIAGAATVTGFGLYTTQGDSESQRAGNRVTIQSLSMRFNIKLGALEADGTSVRLMLVMDRRPAGANATVGDMLIADDILSPYEIEGENRGRFQFLMDKLIDFSAQEGEKSGTYFLKRNIQMEYDGNAGTVADVKKNNFMVVGLSRGNAAAIDIDFSYMFRYTDD